MLMIIPGASADPQWELATSDAGWSAQGYFSTVALPDGNLVLMGGYDGEKVLNDTWRSTDNGATWSLVNPAAGWSARMYQNSVAMPDGSILLIGGQDGQTRNDVWRSDDDGETWTLVTPDAGWTPRESLSCVIMDDGSILVSGGTLPGGYTQFNDVWRSVDGGTTWTEVTAEAEWSRRFGHGMVQAPDGSILVTGGFTFGPGYSNDVWRSQDKVASLMQVTPHAGWSTRYYHSMATMPDGSILLTGGSSNPKQLKNDLWRSTDNGITWKLVDSIAPWTARDGQGSVVTSDGSLVLLGGRDGKYKNGVWRFKSPGSEENMNFFKNGFNNGGFEQSFDKWQTSGWSIDDSAGSAHSGAKSATVHGQQSGIALLSQLVYIKAPSTIRFWYSRHSLTTGDLNVYLDGTIVRQIIGKGEGSDKWIMEEIPITSSGHHTLMFKVSKYSFWTNIDDFTVVENLPGRVNSPMEIDSGITGSSEVFVISPNSTIFLSKTITPHVVKQDIPVNVNIRFTNPGLSPIYDVQILDETLKEFPVTSGPTHYTSSQMLLPNETRGLHYTMSATKPGKYTFNGTSVMFADQDGNYHLIRSNTLELTVLKPLISGQQPDPSFDIITTITGFFRKPATGTMF